MSQFEVATGAFAVSIGMVGPTLIAHGTPEQQQQHLAPILKGEEVWCQLFSEPGSGSDLASLGTRAVRDGDDWIVNGQKVWTSFGQFADYAILLVIFIYIFALMGMSFFASMLKFNSETNLYDPDGEVPRTNFDYIG